MDLEEETLHCTTNCERKDSAVCMSELPTISQRIWKSKWDGILRQVATEKGNNGVNPDARYEKSPDQK